MKKINQNLIDGRILKYILSNKSRFSDWVKRNIKNNKLIEGEDFFIEHEDIKLLRRGKAIKINYFFTLEAAKKIILKFSKNKVAIDIKKELEKGRKMDDILSKMNEEKNTEIKKIEIHDREYPEQLKKINNPPKELFIKGNIENLKEYGIAIVGTRNCSIYGRRVCKNFVNNLVGYNINIISGLAVGIDGCAHKSCIEANGKTIAVLPSGFDNIFPKENEELLNKILESGGTIVTEYPPEFEKTQESCKERNRIVSGLAIGTLVIEAEKRSGTSITVRYTNEQGKKAFCIPSSLLNAKGIGTNEMIKNNKAKLVTDVEDIIKEFPELKLERRMDYTFKKIIEPKQSKEKKVKSKMNLEIEKENLEIYNSLARGPKIMDELAMELNQPIREVAYKLTILELQGVIEEMPGKKFKIK